MSEPTIYGPGGQELTTAQADASAFRVEITFAPETGFGFVRVKSPAANRAHELLGYVLTYLDSRRAAEDIGENGEALRQDVIDTLKMGGASYQMHPQEARLLGVSLIAQAEAAMYTAAGIRIVAEMEHMNVPDAARVFNTVASMVRGQQALLYETHRKAKQQDKAMAQEAANGEGKPS